MAAAASFRGWPKEALAWFDGLEANNDRAWFQANRPVYDASVREPLELLLDDLAAEFGEAKVFRPHRDTRFSADKTPYKTWAAAVIHTTGGGAYYVALSASGLQVASGYYRMAKDQIERFRAAVAAERTGPAIERVVAHLRREKLDIGGEELVRVPRGYPNDHPRGELLRYKGLTAGRMHPPRAWLHTTAAKGKVVDTWRAAAPMHEWLDANVGPSELPRDR